MARHIISGKVPRQRDREQRKRLQDHAEWVDLQYEMALNQPPSPDERNARLAELRERRSVAYPRMGRRPKMPELFRDRLLPYLERARQAAGAKFSRQEAIWDFVVKRMPHNREPRRYALSLHRNFARYLRLAQQLPPKKRS